VKIRIADHKANGKMPIFRNLHDGKGGGKSPQAMWRNHPNWEALPGNPESVFLTVAEAKTPAAVISGKLGEDSHHPGCLNSNDGRANQRKK